LEASNLEEVHMVSACILMQHPPSVPNGGRETALVLLLAGCGNAPCCWMDGREPPLQVQVQWLNGPDGNLKQGILAGTTT
jgi:hypothetical protein